MHYVNVLQTVQRHMRDQLVSETIVGSVIADAADSIHETMEATEREKLHDRQQRRRNVIRDVLAGPTLNTVERREYRKYVQCMRASYEPMPFPADEFE